MARFQINKNGLGCFFCTCTIVQWICIFKEEKYSQLIIDSLTYSREHKGLLLFAYVIMLNHIHLIISIKEGLSISDFMRDFKRYTSKRIAGELSNENNKLFLYIFRKAAEKQNKGVRFKIWRDNFHPMEIISEKWFDQKIKYIHLNPVCKGFVLRPEDWKYSSARNWILDDNSLIKLDIEKL